MYRDSNSRMIKSSITRKQVNVLFAKAKAGELKIERFAISAMYDLADGYFWEAGESMKEDEKNVKAAVNNVFNGKMSAAQDRINKYTAEIFGRCTEKKQAELNRAYV